MLIRLRNRLIALQRPWSRTEVALREGKPLEQVLQSFLKDTEGIKCFVGHNVSFDQKVVGAELYRLGIADTVSTARSLDTMVAAKDYCKIPGVYGYKWPKLIELHRKLFGSDFEDADGAVFVVGGHEQNGHGKDGFCYFNGLFHNKLIIDN